MIIQFGYNIVRLWAKTKCMLKLCYLTRQNLWHTTDYIHYTGSKEMLIHVFCYITNQLQKTALCSYIGYCLPYLPYSCYSFAVLWHNSSTVYVHFDLSKCHLTIMSNCRQKCIRWHVGAITEDNYGILQTTLLV